MEKTRRDNGPSRVNDCCYSSMRMLLTNLKPSRGCPKRLNVILKRCPLSPTIFSIYIDKLEECLESMAPSVVITLLLYADNIILLTRSHDKLGKQLKTLHDFYSKMGIDG